MARDNFLSQDEVDALLQGETGDASAEASPSAAASDGLPVYDLTSPDRVVRGRMHTLEVINDRFSRHLRESLLNFMRRSPDITVGPIRVQQYGDFVRHLPVPTNINMLRIRPLRGTALFVFDPKLIFLVVDNLFGGDGRYHMRIEGRDFTRTEQRIIKRLLDLTLECYGDAWNPVFPLEFDYLRAEMHGKLANIVAPNEVVITTTLQIEFGPVGGFLHICIPYSMIEPIRDLLTNPFRDEEENKVDSHWTTQMSSQMQSADVELTADFVTMNSTIGGMLKLKVGDVLPIDLPSIVTGKVDGVPVMTCSYGTSKNRLALRVKQMVHHQQSDLKKDHD